MSPDCGGDTRQRHASRPRTQNRQTNNARRAACCAARSARAREAPGQGRARAAARLGSLKLRALRLALLCIGQADRLRAPVDTSALWGPESPRRIRLGERAARRRAAPPRPAWRSRSRPPGEVLACSAICLSSASSLAAPARSASLFASSALLASSVICLSSASSLAAPARSASLFASSAFRNAVLRSSAAATAAARSASRAATRASSCPCSALCAARRSSRSTCPRNVSFLNSKVAEATRHVIEQGLRRRAHRGWIRVHAYPKHPRRAEVAAGGGRRAAGGVPGPCARPRGASFRGLLPRAPAARRRRVSHVCICIYISIAKAAAGRAAWGNRTAGAGGAITSPCSRRSSSRTWPGARASGGRDAGPRGNGQERAPRDKGKKMAPRSNAWSLQARMASSSRRVLASSRESWSLVACALARARQAARPDRADARARREGSTLVLHEVQRGVS
jgi:hypothetical protein